MDNVKSPNGLAEIIRAYGDPTHIVAAGTPEEQAWAASILTPILLPEPLMGGKQIHLGCHRLVAQDLLAILQEIHAAGLWPLIHTLESYCFRMSRTTHRLSTHSWGIAVDINAATNPLGSHGDLDPRLIAVFQGHKWTYGGHWPTPDPMHFQFATGY